MIEVLKQRLVACKKDERHLNHAETRYWLQQYKLLAEDAIKAIAESESQEPDVVMHWHSHTWTIINPPPKNSSDVNLYYASPQRKPLTDEECADLWDMQVIHITDRVSAKQFIRDIEAAHGIKEQS